jgi:ABC-type proline/glycine betaine transport system substrate-binding protein
VVSAGALGPLGRNGLYCRNDDVDRFPALAGWRGLNDSAVRGYFGGMLYAFVPGWGPVEEMLSNLGLDYKVVFLGTEAAMTIKSRLQAGLPTLFYLWSPHPLNAQFSLSRIQLPPYSTRARYEEGRSDFPTDVLEKLAAKSLAEISPDLAALYARFTMETATQERLLSAIDAGRQTVMEAVCGWLTVKDNMGVWHRWLNHQPPVVQPSVDEPLFNPRWMNLRWIMPSAMSLRLSLTAMPCASTT